MTLLIASLFLALLNILPLPSQYPNLFSLLSLLISLSFLRAPFLTCSSNSARPTSAELQLSSLGQDLNISNFREKCCPGSLFRPSGYFFAFLSILSVFLVSVPIFSSFLALRFP